MSDRLKLAEELEAAEGPNFDLEMRIFRAVNPQATSRSVPPNYTASIDAAMTLVPEGWESIELRRTDDGEWRAALAGNDAHFMAEDPDEFFVESGNHATPALALCAAALKAGE